MNVGNVNKFLADAQAKGVGLSGGKAARLPGPPAPAPPPSAEGSVGFSAPVRVVSEANARAHWSARHARFAGQAAALRDAAAGVRGLLDAVVRLGVPLEVHLTRRGGRRMDSDNLAGAFKGVRDAFAELLGLDDGDPRLAWHYHQAAGPAGIDVLLATTTVPEGATK